MRGLFRFFITAFLCAGLVVFLVLSNKERVKEWERQGLEYLVSLAAEPYFVGRVRFEEGYVDRTLRLRVKNLQGSLRTDAAPLAIEVDEVNSIDPLTELLLLKPTRFECLRLRARHTPDEGADAEIWITAGPKWRSEIRAQIREISLEHLTPLNPDSLKGAKGKLVGTMLFQNDYQNQAAFQLELHSTEGGSLQARFFDLLLPYLPQGRAQIEMRRIAGTEALVGYSNADLEMFLSDPQTLKTVLHIGVPDYNLNLNLNIQILVDQENAFLQAAEWLGLIRIKTS